MTSHNRKGLRPHLRTPLFVLGLGLIAGAPTLPGCATSSSADTKSKKNNLTVITIPNQADQIATAQQLALKAQKTKDDAKAIELYSQAVKIYSDLPAAWNNMGVLLLNNGRLMEAAEAFGAATERTPNDPRPFYNLGLTWDRAGYLETALEHYSKALSLDDRYLPALRGAIKTESRLGQSSPILVERIRVALFVEMDPQWREYFELQRSWAEAEVRAKAGLPTGSASR